MRGNAQVRATEDIHKTITISIIRNSIITRNTIQCITRSIILSTIPCIITNSRMPTHSNTITIGISRTITTRA